MLDTGNFDSRFDIQKTIPNLSLNVNDAIKTGIISDTGVEVSYNGIEDPSQIVGRVEDVFQAISFRNSVVNKEFARIKADTSASVNPEAGEDN